MPATTTATAGRNPQDDRGRFIQVVGEISVHAAVLPKDADAVTIGRVSLGPPEVRDAYRATLLGLHYTVSVPIDPAQAAAAPDCSVQVVFHDGRTGLEHRAEKTIELTP
jgi:hypothetical protein